jgi:hypothetical protein
MVRLSLAASLLAALVFQSSAHFLLNYPPTIGFDDHLESTAPCGSFTVDFSTDNLTNFYVGGSEVSVTSVHPQANWLFRATLGSNQSTTNWTQLMPIVQQTGLGNFCEPAVAVPGSWADQQGILSVVQKGPDGILYQVSWNQQWLSTRNLDLFQCAAVNFVAGTGTPNQDCTNVTGLTAVFTTDPDLESVANGTNSTATTTSTSTGTSSTASAKSAATDMRAAYQTATSLLIFVSIASVALLGGLT